MKLILVEHAQSVANALGINQGHKEYELSPLGREQARKLALRLKDEKIDFAYSSDLTRAKDTAKEILKFHSGTELVCLEELREKNKGSYQGKHTNVLKEDLKKLGISYEDYDFKGGEKETFVRKRTLEFYEKILEKHKGKTVLVVTHGGPYVNLLLHLLGRPRKDSKICKLKSAAMTVIEVDDEGNHKIKLLSCVKHLE
ncbi:MAG: histidine phosphatase family protein [archaeon]